MQKFRKTFILFSILLIAVFAVYLIYNPQIFSRGPELLMPNFQEEKLTKLEITNKDKTDILEKQNGDWYLMLENNKFRADSETIQRLIVKFPKLQKNQLVSQNKEKHNIFQVDNNSGVKVRVYQDDDLVGDFISGKSGPDYNSTYVRLAGEDKVYLVKENITYLVSVPDWRDLTVSNIDSAKIKAFSLIYPGKQIDAVKEADAWKITAPAEVAADNEKVANFIHGISRIMANDIVSGATLEDTGLGKPRFSIKITTEDGSESTVLIGSQTEDNNYYVKNNNNDIIYIVDEAVIDNIKKDQKDLQ